VFPSQTKALESIKEKEKDNYKKEDDKSDKKDKK
jgi:hypothetical protein